MGGVERENNFAVDTIYGTSSASSNRTDKVRICMLWFESNTRKKNIKKLFDVEISHNAPMLCTEYILIGNAVHRSACLHNLILALTMNG